MKALDYIMHTVIALVIAVFGLVYFMLWGLWEIRKVILIIVGVTTVFIVCQHFFNSYIDGHPEQYAPIYICIGIVCLVIIGMILVCIASIFRSFRKMREMEDEAYLNRKDLMKQVKESVK